MAGIEGISPGIPAEPPPTGSAPAASARPASGAAGSAAAEVRRTAAGRAEAVNRALKRLDVRIRFQLEESEEVRMLVVEEETGRIIRKIPPDRFLRATEGFAENTAYAGLIYDYPA